jgi:hypothetical protein
LIAHWNFGDESGVGSRFMESGVGNQAYGDQRDEDTLREEPRKPDS